MRIRKLDPVVSSQIAAGEVVERPASVVKELVENSLDAGASKIYIEFSDSGLSLIKVSDDGTGMTREEAIMSVERFATSKLRSFQDLNNTSTLGFRGEALPSIASCSKITLLTRMEGTEAGTALEIHGGNLVHVEERGLPVGTTVEVRDLFYNTPARLKFIKTKSRERKALIEAVERLALAWPGRRFELASGGKTILRTGGLGQKNTVAEIFGPGTQNSMVPVEFETSPPAQIKVTGMVGLPALNRRQRDRQMFSVNARPIRVPWLPWVLDESYRGLLPPKTYPVAVLNLVIPPEDLDINVHPTKAEVRFKNENEIKRGIIGGISRALVTAGFGFHQEMPEDPRPASHHSHTGSSGPPWHRLVPAKAWPPVVDGGYLPGTVRDSEAAPFRSFGFNDAEAEIDAVPRYLGHLKDTYLIAKTGNSLLLVDKHAYMEAIAYQRLLEAESGSQDLLVSEILRLSPVETDRYEANEAFLQDLGFSTRLIGETSVMVTGVPLVMGVPLTSGDLKHVLAALENEISREPSPERLFMAGRVALAACHASVRAKEKLGDEEARALLRQLSSPSSPRTCPHGRPTVKEIPLAEIDGFFGRKPGGDS